MGGRVMDGVKKKVFQNIDIVSYALKVSVNGVICVFVAHFTSLTSLTVNIHVSTKTCVTGNNFILHKALQRSQLRLLLVRLYNNYCYETISHKLNWSLT